MAILVRCPTCVSKLRVPEQALGKRIKCPKCACTFAARGEDDAPTDAEPEVGVTERPAVSARRGRPAQEEAEESAPARRKVRTEEEDEAPPKRRRRADDEEPAPVSRRKSREAEPEDPEEAPEAPDDSDSPSNERRKKKKKRRKLRRPVPDDDAVGTPAWVWWTFGGGGIGLVMLVLFCLTAFLSYDNPFKFYAAYLLIMMPISTVIFFGAMFLSSVIVGAMEIGEIHVSLVKAFILVLFVNLVSLIPGFYLTGILMFVVLLAGLMTLFRLDVWEARIVIFFNWVLNFGAKFVLMAAILGWATHGGDRGRHDDDGGAPSKGGKSAPAAVQDDDDGGDDR